MTSGADLIAKERLRHSSKFNATHDDTHTGNELLIAAILLTLDVSNQDRNCICDEDECEDWMESLALKARTKYASDYVSRLAIAGAMIAAEIDRLNRLKK